MDVNVRQFVKDFVCDAIVGQKIIQKPVEIEKVYWQTMRKSGKY